MKSTSKQYVLNTFMLKLSFTFKTLKQFKKICTDKKTKTGLMDRLTDLLTERYFGYD